jgi:hypothetical protein
MPRYRIYIIDEHGQLVCAADFDCADDDEARELASEFDGRGVELWRKLASGPHQTTDLNPPEPTTH